MSFLITFPAGGGSATYKDAVRVARDTQLALTGSTPLVIDGVTLVDKDRVLLRGQSAGAENGIYVVAISGGSYVLSRAKDADTDKEVLPNMLVPVAEGTSNVDKIFQLTTNAPITLGVTVLTFSDSVVNKANRDLGNLTSPTAINQSLLFADDTSYNIGAAAASRPQTVYVKSAVISPKVEADNAQTTIATASLQIKAGDSVLNNRGQLQLYVRSNNLALVPTPVAGLTINPNVSPVIGDSATVFNFSAGSGRTFDIKVDAGNVTNKAELSQGGQKFFDISHNGTNVSQLQLLTSNAARLTITDSASTFSNTIKGNVYQAVGGLGTPMQFEPNATYMWFGVPIFSRAIDNGTGFETTEPATAATFGERLSLLRVGNAQGNVSRLSGMQLLYKLGINNKIPASGVRTTSPGTLFVRGARTYTKGGFTIYNWSTTSSGTTLTINYGGQTGTGPIGFTVGAGDYIESSGSPGVRAKVLSVTSVSGQDSVVVVDQALNAGNITAYQDIAIFRRQDDTDVLVLTYDGKVGIGTATPTEILDVAGNSQLNGSVVINESGADKDTRIEGDTDANLVFVDASTDSVGIGTSSPTQKFDVNGGLRFQGGLTVKSLHAQAGTANVITVSVNDYYIGVDCSGAAKTVNLPAAATAGAGKTFVIKDETGSAATNNITIDASGAELIDGAATYVMAVNRESVTLVCDGTGWQII